MARRDAEEDDSGFEESEERYDRLMIQHRPSGEVKVRIKRLLPSRSDVGTVNQSVVPDWGALNSFVRQHAWYGDDAEYSWAMLRNGRIVTKGDLVLTHDERVRRMAENGEWPLPHDALFSTTLGSRGSRAAQAQPPPSPPPAEPPPVAAPSQQGWPPDYDHAEARPARVRDHREEDWYAREDDRYRGRERDREPPALTRSSDPVVSRLLDELSDARTDMSQVIERSARDTAQMKAQFEQLVARLAAPATQAVSPPAEASRSLMDDPAVTSLASIGAAVTALRTVGGTLGMVDGAQIAELNRKHEAQQLKAQIERLNEKLNEVLTAKSSAATEPQAPPAAPAPEGEEEALEEEPKGRTTHAGPAVIIENEEGEIDLVKSLAASAPGVLALFKAMQDQKSQAAEAQYHLLRNANREMERQTKLINEYATAQERLTAAGGAMPEMPDDDSASGSDDGNVGSDASATSLADQESALALSSSSPRAAQSGFPLFPPWAARGSTLGRSPALSWAAWTSRKSRDTPSLSASRASRTRSTWSRRKRSRAEKMRSCAHGRRMC